MELVLTAIGSIISPNKFSVTVVQTVYRPDLFNASLYEKDGYNNFTQRFCTHSITLDNFSSNQNAKQGMHIQE